MLSAKRKTGGYGRGTLNVEIITEMKGGFFLSSMNNSALKMKCNHIAVALIQCLSEKKQLVRKLPVLAAMLNMVSGYLHGVDGFLHVCVANPVLASEKQ